MSLTGPLFLGLVVAATVAAFVALVVVWPRLAGSDLPHVAARAGLLVGVNALVLLTAATQLNAQFLFFADWTDLRGALGGTTVATRVARGASASEAANRSVQGSSAVAGQNLPPLPATGVGPDGVVTYTVTGPLSGITATVVVVRVERPAPQGRASADVGERHSAPARRPPDERVAGPPPQRPGLAGGQHRRVPPGPVNPLAGRVLRRSPEGAGGAIIEV